MDEVTRQLDQAGKENFVEAKRLERGESKIRKKSFRHLMKQQKMRETMQKTV